MELKNIWPGITESQRLEQNYKKNNRYRGNLRSRFQQQKLYLYKKKKLSVNSFGEAEYKD